jgi:hypothetical protein
MIKFYKQVDISKSTLLLSVASCGMSANFSSAILIGMHNFENVGFLFSEYLNGYASYVNNEIKYNAEVYFNEQSRVVLIDFYAGASTYFRQKFFEELKNLIQTYSIGNVIIYGGISKTYTNDEELKSQIVQTYAITNNEAFDYQKYKIRNFADLVKMEDRKNIFSELKYVEHCGMAKKLVKFLFKNNIQFHYFFAFSGELFDPLAGLALYYSISHYLGFRTEATQYPKKVENISGLINKITTDFKLDPFWSLFLKE